MADKVKLESIFNEHGFGNFKWINPVEFQVRQWVRMKCEFGCPSYGKKGTCPPNVPGIDESREFFEEYSLASVFRIKHKIENPDDTGQWSKGINLSLLEIEREVFKAGYHKAFLLFMDECQLCRECSGTREECYKPHQARPSSEALGVDVFGTVRNIGFPINVLSSINQEMNSTLFC